MTLRSSPSTASSTRLSSALPAVRTSVTWNVASSAWKSDCRMPGASIRSSRPASVRVGVADRGEPARGAALDHHPELDRVVQRHVPQRDEQPQHRLERVPGLLQEHDAVVGAAADGDDAHRLEHADRLAHRRARDAVARREVALRRQAVARLERARGDRRLQLAEDVLERARCDIGHGRTNIQMHPRLAQ